LQPLRTVLPIQTLPARAPESQGGQRVLHLRLPELSTPSPRRHEHHWLPDRSLILAALCIYAVYFAYRLLTDPNTLLDLMRVGIELGSSCCSG